MTRCRHEWRPDLEHRPQGSEEWLEVRKGRITASRFKDAREKLKNGEPSGKAKLYAFDVARQRVGGTVAEVYQNAAMRFGQEQEPLVPDGVRSPHRPACDGGRFCPHARRRVRCLG
jgi:hypothetical protein